MKTKLFNQATFKNLILILVLNLSISTFAVNSIEVDFSTYSNAFAKTVSGTSNGVDTYKTFTITIPFYSNTLDLLSLRTDYPGSCSGSVMINVNGANSTYASNSNTVLHKWYDIPNLPVGTTYYTVKSFCGNVEIAGSRQLIRVVIVKEAAPVLNLNITASCSTNNDGTYNGYINIKGTGTYTNATYLYLKTTAPTTACSSTQFNLPTLGNGAANGSINNSGFFSCNINGTYTVQLLYKRVNLSGNLIVYTIPSGSYNWTDYSFTKTFRTCLNVADPIRDLALKNSNIKITNPVKDIMTLEISNDISSYYEITFYDFSGLIVKKENITNVNKKGANTINVQDLKKGIYLVEINNGKEILREKIIKE